MTISELGTIAGPPIFGLVVDLTDSYQAKWGVLAGIALAGASIAALASRGEARACGWWQAAGPPSS